MSLQQYLKGRTDRRLEESEAKRIFHQIVEGISYCHSLNIVHRDIKLENILLDAQRNIKIIDYGFSICVDPGQRLKIFCGTPSYMAPEIVQKHEYSGAKADVWALGVLLFVLLAGKYPFKGINDIDLYQKIKKCRLELPHNLSEQSKNLISKILRYSPSERPAASEVNFVCFVSSLMFHFKATTTPLAIIHVVLLGLFFRMLITEN